MTFEKKSKEIKSRNMQLSRTRTFPIASRCHEEPMRRESLWYVQRTARRSIWLEQSALQRVWWQRNRGRSYVGNCAYSLGKMRRHQRILSTGTSWSNLYFNLITLDAVVRTDRGGAMAGDGKPVRRLLQWSRWKTKVLDQVTCREKFWIFNIFWSTFSS